MTKLVLIRHGESDWNKQNRFTGWTDVDLSEKGLNEAHASHTTAISHTQRSRRMRGIPSGA